MAQLGDAETVLASDVSDVVAKIQNVYWAGVLVDTSLVADELPRVLAAVRAAPWRPLVLLVTKEPERNLDPDLISLVVRKPYEVKMVTGILLASISDIPHPTASDVPRQAETDTQAAKPPR